MSGNSEFQIALLRGINVGNAKRISMSELRSIAKEIGFSDINTVLNSGNLIFKAQDLDAMKSEMKLEKAIEDKFGFSVNVIVLTSTELERVVEENLLGKIASDFSRYIVYVFKNREDIALIKALNEQNWGSEVLAIGTLAAYLWCPAGVIASKLVKAVERLFGRNATGRNWNTLLKLESISRGQGGNHG